ncbi:MAG TPA: hypothetical protein VG733_16010 [Chthoniobacteraceae bacterium]|nr:hypothetical protein [Chthoniobacteraceae bacterium]
MRFGRALYVIALVAQFACLKAVADDLPGKESFVARVGEVWQRMAPLYAERGMEFPTFDPAEPRFREAHESWRKIDVWVCQFKSVEVQCVPKSNELVMFSREFPLENDTLYDKPPKPAWSEEHAISEARAWATAFLGEFPSNVGTARARYAITAMQSSKYYDGEWYITWPRVDSRGHPFACDSVRVTLSEKHGAIIIGQFFGSKYEERQDAPISREQAIEISAGPARRLLGSQTARDWFQSDAGTDATRYKLGAASAELWIVNPDRIVPPPAVEDIFSGGPNGRLAWGVTYTLTDGNLKETRHSLSVWVDAYSKEILEKDSAMTNGREVEVLDGAFRYFISIGTLYSLVFLAGLGVILRSNHLRGRPLAAGSGRLALFLLVLLLAGDCFSALWGSWITGSMYYSPDYKGMDFLPWLPVTPLLTNYRYEEKIATLLGGAFWKLEGVWVIFSAVTWGVTIFAYKISLGIVARLRRARRHENGMSSFEGSAGRVQLP